MARPKAKPLPVLLLFQGENRAASSPGSGVLTWAKNFSLDYLALDFNSASPAPAQQVPFVSENSRETLFPFRFGFNASTLRALFERS